MLECHYGVPMTGAVVNTLNTRLDAPILSFSLDHGEAKVVIVDREYQDVACPHAACDRDKPLGRVARAHHPDRGFLSHRLWAGIPDFARADP
jgi:acyl-CoA synthetase (AMP-forming)/AMP-acid ligase II